MNMSEDAHDPIEETAPDRDDPTGADLTGQPPTPEPRSTPRRVLAALAVALVLGLLWLAGTVPVTADGMPVWVLRGLTVGGLEAQGQLSGRPGDLVSVHGKLLRAGAGDEPSIRVNGALATSATVLGFGDRVTSGRGPDRVEPIVVRVEHTPPGMRRVGVGPVESVEDSGTPGTVAVRVGAVSGDVVSRRTVSTGYPMVVRREPAWRGRKAVALTFDDGPWPRQTEKVLAILKAAGAKATFFEIGRQVENRPQLSRAVVAAGMEVGTHSQNHKLLAGASRKVVVSEISRGADAIRKVLGAWPTWYRPAGGSVNSFVYREAKKLKLRVVLWTVDPRDWSRPGAARIQQRVLDHVQPGAVILMHDGGGDRSQTIAALPRILRGLKARGYKVVTLSDLFRVKPSGKR